MNKAKNNIAIFIVNMLYLLLFDGDISFFLNKLKINASKRKFSDIQNYAVYFRIDNK